MHVDNLAKLKSEANGEGHIADSASIALSDPSVPLFSPVDPPAVLDPPPHSAPVPHHHHRVVQVVPALREHPRTVVLQSVPGDAYCHWSAPQLLQEGGAVALREGAEGGEPEGAALLLAAARPRGVLRGVGIEGVQHHSVGLQKAVGALQVPALAAEGEPVVRAVHHLLHRERHEEAEGRAVDGREGLHRGEGVAGPAGTLEPHLSAAQRPVDLDRFTRFTRQ